MQLTWINHYYGIDFFFFLNTEISIDLSAFTANYDTCIKIIKQREVRMRIKTKKGPGLHKDVKV